MKNILFAAAVCLLLTNCSLEKPIVEKAKQAVEGCLNAIDKGDIKKVREEFYTSEFVQAETEEELTEKFKKLREVTGAMQSFEAAQGGTQEETGEEASVLLTYTVKHDRVTTREEFVVVIEGGKHKIGSHMISNE